MGMNRPMIVFVASRPGIATLGRSQKQNGSFKFQCLEARQIRANRGYDERGCASKSNASASVMGSPDVGAYISNLLASNRIKLGGPLRYAAT